MNKCLYFETINLKIVASVNKNVFFTFYMLFFVIPRRHQVFQKMSLFVGSGCDSIKKNYFAAFVCAMDDGEYGAGSDSEPELSRYYPAKENALSRAQQRERQNENGEPSPLIACIEECAIARSVARLLDDMLNTPVAWGMFRALLGAAAGMNEVTPGWLANCFVNRAEPPEDEVELDVLDFYINKSLLDMAADRGLD